MKIRGKENQSHWMERYQNYLQGILQKDYHYFVAVTRKGYYFAKVLPAFLKNSSRYKMLRDRDILKSYDFKQFRNKKILLFDDTANTGETLRNIKAFIEKRTSGKASVDVSAFAISGYVLQNKETLFGTSKLFFYGLLDESEMTEFSLYELEKIHDEMIPYVVDLPHFEKMKMPFEEFQMLIQKSGENWRFYDYTFELQNNVYKNGYFLYENENLQNYLGDTLLASIVKCRYRVIEEDEQKKCELVFTPFVMLRSANYYEMAVCLHELYKGTAYEEVLKNRSTNNLDDYVAIYRDVVYNLSSFVGSVFKQYIKFHCGEELRWNYNLTDLKQNEKLKESIDNLFQGINCIQNYYKRLQNCRFNYWRKVNLCIQENAETSFREISNYVLGKLSMEKLKALQKQKKQASEEKEGILFEDVEKMVAERFVFRGIKEFKQNLVKIILLALDCSFMSNNLEMKDGEIKRSFCFGECSEIYFGYDIRLFYMAIYAYYNNVKAMETKYHQYYQEFLNRLYSYLRYNDYFKYEYITKQDFEYFSEYFDLEGELLEREIRNKKYLLKDPYAGNPYNIAVMKYVSNLKFE